MDKYRDKTFKKKKELQKYDHYILSNTPEGETSYTSTMVHVDMGDTHLCYELETDREIFKIKLQGKFEDSFFKFVPITEREDNTMTKETKAIKTQILGVLKEVKEVNKKKEANVAKLAVLLGVSEDEAIQFIKLI